MIAARNLSEGQSASCDIIRYLAALSVTSHHLLGRLDVEAYAPEHTLSNLGSLGVLVFFVLSGFLIGYTIQRKRAAHAGYGLAAYMVERTVRIFLVFVPALLMAAFVGWFASTFEVGHCCADFDHYLPWNFFMNLFMLSGVPGILAHQQTFLLMGPSWTLNYEYFAYMMLGALMLPWHSRLPMFGRGVRVIVFLTFGGLMLQLRDVELLGFSWILGVVIVYGFFLAARWEGQALAAGLVLVILVSTAIAFGGASERLEPFLPSVLIAGLLFIAILCTQRWKPAGWLSRCASTCAGFSYSLYITHLIGMWYLTVAGKPLLNRVIHGWGKGAAFVTVLILLNLLAWCFSLFTERQNERVRRLFLRRYFVSLASQKAA